MSDGVKVITGLIAGAYLATGVVHSIWFEFAVSRTDCAADPEGLVYIFCNTGLGISHAVIVIGWPLYWL